MKITDEQSAIDRSFERDNEQRRARVIAVLGLFMAIVLAFCVKEVFAAPVSYTTKGSIVLSCNGVEVSRHSVETEMSERAIAYALAHGGKASCVAKYPDKTIVFDFPAPTTTPPPPALSLLYSPTPAGSYVALAGATVSGGINVRVSGDCTTTPAGPWTFAVDGTTVNTQTGCPYAMPEDDQVYDTRQLANGAHTITAKAGTTVVTADVTVANAPAALGVPFVTATTAATSVTLTWAAIPGATGYEVERCVGTGCTNFAALSGSPTSALRYDNTGLPAGYVLAYRVRAIDATRKGAYSAVVTTTTPSAASGTAALQWTPPTQNTDGSPLTTLAGYRIRYSTVGIAGPSLSQTIEVPNASTSSYVVTGLAAGTWAFAIEVYTSAGVTSQLSNYVTRVVP